MGQETLPVTWPVENTSAVAKVVLFLISEHSRELKRDKYGRGDKDFPPLCFKKLSYGNLLLPNQRGMDALLALVGSHYFYQHCLTIESILIFVWKFTSIPTPAHCSSPHLASSAFSSTPSLLACESHRHPAFVLCFYKLLSYRYSGVGLRLPRFLFSPAYCRGPTGQED